MKAQLEHADPGGTHDMSSQHDLIQDNVLESHSYIGLEVNSAKCLAVYGNKIWRHKTMSGAYFQDAENVSLWRNEVFVFNESVTGSVAGEVTTYPPSVRNIVTLKASLEWAVAVREGGESGTEGETSPLCVPAPLGMLLSESTSTSALCTTVHVSYGWID